MSDQLLDNIVENKQGRFEVSTIRTFAGGGANTKLFLWSCSDYAETVWPFETVIFPAGDRIGLYHEAYETEEEARVGHARIVDTLQRDLEFPGETVVGPFGNPALTPEQWKNRKRKEGAAAR